MLLLVVLIAVLVVDVLLVSCVGDVMSAGKLAVDVFREVEREKEPWPTGCFPRAFSLMLRDCRGTASSTSVLVGLYGCESDVRLLAIASSLSSSSSSSPMAKAPCSGTLLRWCEERADTGLRMLSREPLRAGLCTPEGTTSPTLTPRSLRSCACRSSSATAPSTVESRKALKRFRLRTITSTKRRFAAAASPSQHEGQVKDKEEVKDTKAFTQSKEIRVAIGKAKQDKGHGPSSQPRPAPFIPETSLANAAYHAVDHGKEISQPRGETYLHIGARG